MTFLNPVESLKKVTLALEKKNKFSYINIPKSSIVALSKNSENSFPNYFAKNVITSLKNSDKNVMKAISHTLISDINDGKHYKIGLHKNAEYFYSNIFEYYYLNDRDVYNILINYYIKNTPKAVVSLHDKKVIQKYLGFNSHVINIPFNNYYDKLDYVSDQLSEIQNEIDYCILDCGIFGLALMSKVWNNLDISVVDLGKTISLSKTSYNQSNGEK